MVSLRSAADRAGRDCPVVLRERSGWSVRQLDRQIASQFYERSKAARRTLVAKSKPDDETSPDDHIRDPFVLEFLNLKDEYSESELEDALIRHLEKFLMELGGEFTFIARQKRLRVGDQWYRVDLLLFHRRLRCLILIDLKLGRFTHADAGQMNMYLSYATQHWTIEGENPPTRLILCSERNEAVAHYALGNLANKVLAREYKLTLPEESVLVQELAATRRSLQNGHPTKLTTWFSLIGMRRVTGGVQRSAISPW